MRLAVCALLVVGCGAAPVATLTPAPMRVTASPQVTALPPPEPCDPVVEHVVAIETALFDVADVAARRAEVREGCRSSDAERACLAAAETPEAIYVCHPGWAWGAYLPPPALPVHDPPLSTTIGFAIDDDLTAQGALDPAVIRKHLLLIDIEGCLGKLRARDEHETRAFTVELVINPRGAVISFVAQPELPEVGPCLDWLRQTSFRTSDGITQVVWRVRMRAFRYRSW